jgi:hypothetical protein
VRDITERQQAEQAAQLLGGELDIDKAPGHIKIIAASVPLKAQET